MKKSVLFFLLAFSAQQLSAQMALSFTQINAGCNNACNGSATATVTGGTGPYAFNWNTIPPQTTQNASNLCAGTYTVTVVDANSGTATGTVTILQPTAIVVSVTVSQPIICNGAYGNLSSSVSGGTPPYTYNWIPMGYTTPTASNLPAGNYTLQVTDAQGCVNSASVTLTQPPPPNITISPAAATLCAGSSMTLIGGGAMVYSWSPLNATSASLLITPTTTTTYTLTGADANGCTGTATSVITVAPVPAINGFTVIEAGCNMSDGSSTVNPSGGTLPYTYTWSTGLTTVTQINEPAGNYGITVTDINGCTAYGNVTIGDSCDFVWPGDANDDAVADNMDILDIGVANGATGTVRANATTNWIGQASSPWGQTLASGTDYKWVDCDGNGTIDLSDTNVVVLNFGQTHNNRTGAAPVYNASQADLAISMNQSTIAASSAGSLTVSLGNSSVPASNVYGLAFTLNFDGTQIDATSFAINNSSSWMGTVGSNLMGIVLRPVTGANSVQVAITRYDHNNTNGFGAIGQMNFMTTSAMTGTGNMQNVNFSINNVTIISSNETVQTVNAVNDSVIVADPAVITGITNVSESQMALYPNPAQSQINIVTDAQFAGIMLNVQISDVSGRIVSATTISGGTVAPVSVNDLSDGVYFVKIMNGNTLAGTRKIAVHH